jgi:hypothetical protein
MYHFSYSPHPGRAKPNKKVYGVYEFNRYLKKRMFPLGYAALCWRAAYNGAGKTIQLENTKKDLNLINYNNNK